jgi:hypothetical protein
VASRQLEVQCKRAPNLQELSSVITDKFGEHCTSDHQSNVCSHNIVDYCRIMMRITGEKSDDCNYNRKGGAYICALHNAYRVLISRENLTRSI